MSERALFTFHPRTFVSLWLPYGALVLVHVVSGLRMEQPLILADELGYLGNARYLAGAAHLPNMYGSQFYHFGYSLFLVPAFWLFTDPIATYRAVLVVNALLVSAVYFPLVYILDALFDVPAGRARWIALACSLYPSLVLYSNFAWTENAFIPFYALATALFGTYVASPSSRVAIAFGLVAGLLYTIHPRALPVVAIVLAYLTVLALVAAVPKRHAALSAAAMGAVFGLTRAVNAHLKALGWSGGGEISATKLAGRLVPGGDFTLLIERAMGQALYLIQASHGLVLVGLAAVVWMTLQSMAFASPRRVVANPRTAVSIFVLTTASGVFAASCTAKLYSVHGPAGVRGADFIYGRYNEAFAVVLLAFGLAALARRRAPLRRSGLAVAGVAAATLCLTAVVATEVKDAQLRHDPSVPAEDVAEVIPPAAVAAAAVPGVYPLVVWFDGLDLYAMSFAALGSFLLIVSVLRFTLPGGLALVLLSFGWFALENHRHFVLPAVAKARPRLDFVDRLDRVGPIEAIAYDVRHHEPEIFFGAQYLMPDTMFTRFDSGKRETPGAEAVISGNKWRQARRLDATFVVSSGWDNALWVLPGTIRSRLPDVSYRGVVLGVEPELGIQEAGFHLPERYLGAPGRWTNGAAALKIPLDRERPPDLLGIETIVPGREDATLRVVANGVELWQGPVPSTPWSKTFELDGVPLDDELMLELVSDTVARQRRLGVMVRGIRLMARGEAAYEGVTLGAEALLGFEESGFHASERIDGAPGRWTNGAAALTVPLDPDNPPRRLAIETTAPGRDGVELRVLANGVELFGRTVPPEPWSETFSLETVPMNDTLVIEIESDTFIPAETHEDSADTRRLGVAIRAIRLTARDRFR